MLNELLEVGSGVAINYISDELIQRLNTCKDSKAVLKLWETLDNWALSFEMDHDGTIVTSGIFQSYVKNYHIMERVVSYVLLPDGDGLPEPLFLDQLVQTMTKELEQRQERSLSPENIRVIRDFLESLLHQT